MALFHVDINTYPCPNKDAVSTNSSYEKGSRALIQYKDVVLPV